MGARRTSIPLKLIGQGNCNIVALLANFVIESYCSAGEEAIKLSFSRLIRLEAQLA